MTLGELIEFLQELKNENGGHVRVYTERSDEGEGPCRLREVLEPVISEARKGRRIVIIREA
jgi:hypothetical protein